jgi:hypothetical protein
MPPLFKLYAPILAVALAAAASGVQAQVPELGVLLPIELSQGDTHLVRPTMWSLAGGDRMSVKSGDLLTLSFKVVAFTEREAALEISLSGRLVRDQFQWSMSGTFAIDKPVRVQLGDDPQTSWLLEFTPSVKPRPQ